jgi:8-oxo-dGTP pyrophosphatase MutT (NUDIX family)
MPKSVSCGVLLFNEDGEVFLAHATGTRHWDVLKGQADPGEIPQATALREAKEEAGLDLSAIHLEDLGVLAYRPDKRLHLFAARIARESVEPAKCICTSFFLDQRTGERRPEMDRFAWVPRANVGELCGPSLRRVLEEQFAAGLGDRLALQRPKTLLLARTGASQGK